MKQVFLEQKLSTIPKYFLLSLPQMLFQFLSHRYTHHLQQRKYYFQQQNSTRVKKQIKMVLTGPCQATGAS